MSGRSRLVALIVAILAVATAFLTSASTSSAKPAYTHNPTLSLSATAVSGCSTVTVTGTNFAPNELVDITMHTKTYALTTVQADGAGSFSTTITVPAGANGHHTIIATGRTHDSANAKLTVTGCAGTGGQSIGGTGTSFTGVAVIGISVPGSAADHRRLRIPDQRPPAPGAGLTCWRVAPEGRRLL